MRKGIGLLLLGLCLVVGLVYFFQRGAEQDASSPEPPSREFPADPGMYFKDVLLIGRRGGVKQWEMDASLLQVGEGQSEAVIKEIGSGIIFREGEPYLYFTGREGIWNRNTDDFHLLGEVEITTDEERFLIEGLRYNSRQETFVSTGPVVAYIGEKELHAERMEGDLAKKQMSISGQVEITQGEKQRITADHVVYDSEGKAVELFGNVRLELELDRKEQLDA
ncbi:MAG TPA: LPS export ABC transporter periplasmic protein LptC [Firmicutes bacterium]|nr:LPS export ABC transporter periplasmic protein LptC [Bacillota bacterium]